MNTPKNDRVRQQMAIVAGVFGFAGIARDAAWIAKVLVVVFIVLFLVSLVMGRRAP